MNKGWTGTFLSSLTCFDECSQQRSISLERSMVGRDAVGRIPRIDPDFPLLWARTTAPVVDALGKRHER